MLWTGTPTTCVYAFWSHVFQQERSLASSKMMKTEGCWYCIQSGEYMDLGLDLGSQSVPSQSRSKPANADVTVSDRGFPRVSGWRDRECTSPLHRRIAPCKVIRIPVSLRSCPLPIFPLCLSREEGVIFFPSSQRSKEAKNKKNNAWSQVRFRYTVIP